MIRPAIRPIVIASVVSGIVTKALEQKHVEDSWRTVLEKLRDEADHLIEQWPDRVRSNREIKDIERHLFAFTDKTGWDVRPRSMQTYTMFFAAMFEDTKERIKDPKKRLLIDRVLERVNDVWLHDVGHDREREWCLQAGIRAALLFESIMSE